VTLSLRIKKIEMIRKLFLLSAVSASAILFNSCKKAGLDGDATMVVYVKHHEAIIKNHVSYPDTVYLEFNATEAPPSLSDYDTYVVGTVGEDHIHIPNMHTGKYYVFATGMDSAGPYRVTGGMAIRIKRSQKGTEFNQDIAATE
jgi:hypothetical protein